MAPFQLSILNLNYHVSLFQPYWPFFPVVNLHWPPSCYILFFLFVWLTLAYPLSFSFKSLIQQSLCWLPQCSLGSQNSLCSQHCIFLPAAFNILVIIYVLKFLCSIWFVSSTRVMFMTFLFILYFKHISQCLSWKRSLLNILNKLIYYFYPT